MCDVKELMHLRLRLRDIEGKLDETLETARDTFDAMTGLYSSFHWDPTSKEELRHIRSLVQQVEDAGPPEEGDAGLQDLPW